MGSSNVNTSSDLMSVSNSNLNYKHPLAETINNKLCNPSCTLNIAHLNASSLWPNIDEVRVLVKSCNLHGFAFTETWLKKKFILICILIFLNLNCLEMIEQLGDQITL